MKEQLSPFPAPSNPNPGSHYCRYTVEVAHIWEQFSSCLIFYVQRLACQGTCHLRACRGWTVQKTFTGTYCSLLIREGTGEFPGKQMSRYSNSCFSLTPFYWGKVDVQPAGSHPEKTEDPKRNPVEFDSDSGTWDETHLS